MFGPHQRTSCSRDCHSHMHTLTHTHKPQTGQKTILSVETEVRNLTCGMLVLLVYRKEGLNLVPLNPADPVHWVAKFPFGSQPPLQSFYFPAAPNPLSTQIRRDLPHCPESVPETNFQTLLGSADVT